MLAVRSISALKFRPLLAGLALGLVFSFGLGAQPKSSGQSATKAVYTQQQADAGAKLYSQHCAACHGAKLQGVSGPPLGGAAFAAKWLGGNHTADDLYYIMHTQMPLNAPGSLKESEYLDILAFVLQQNGFPAGKNALSIKELKDIKLTKPQKASK